MSTNTIDILTIMLSWNRPELLEKTICSYFRTISVPHDFYVVDNSSESLTISVLKRLANKYKFKVIYLEENMGGIAFNKVLNDVNIDKYRYVHFSENDLEYRADWDKKLLNKMDIFGGVGQLSPFSLHPEVEKGEIWGIKPGNKIQKGDQVIYISPKNIGTTCIVRKELIERGLRWENIKRGNLRFPADNLFSNNIKKMGYKVAWNDRYLATNLGHNITEFQKDVDYYINNYNKKRIQLDGFNKRLIKHKYKLVKKEDGTYEIEML